MSGSQILSAMLICRVLTRGPYYKRELFTSRGTQFDVTYADARDCSDKLASDNMTNQSNIVDLVSLSLDVLAAARWCA